MKFDAVYWLKFIYLVAVVFCFFALIVSCCLGVLNNNPLYLSAFRSVMDCTDSYNVVSAFIYFSVACNAAFLCVFLLLWIVFFGVLAPAVSLIRDVMLLVVDKFKNKVSD